MRMLKVIVTVVACLVFGICCYSFLLGNEVFKGKFENDAISWYILATGIFCPIALYLVVSILEVLKKK
jgi:magnesium-transporting ATPase (P-type)